MWQLDPYQCDQNVIHAFEMQIQHQSNHVMSFFLKEDFSKTSERTHINDFSSHFAIQFFLS
jgi:hypothetical protein